MVTDRIFTALKAEKPANRAVSPRSSPLRARVLRDVPREERGESAVLQLNANRIRPLTITRVQDPL